MKYKGPCGFLKCSCTLIQTLFIVLYGFDIFHQFISRSKVEMENWEEWVLCSGGVGKVGG